MPFAVLAAVPLVVGGGTTAAAEEPTLAAAVEDFAYPGAAKILADRGITLRTGDGNILLADCASGANLVRLFSRSLTPSEACFKINGPTGYLALEIPQVYNIKGDDHAIKATLKTDGTVTTVDIKRNEWTPVGEGSSSGATTLLELNATDGPAGTATTPHPAVGKLSFGAPGRADSRGCTGTLIDPQWVLTAAGCFADTPLAAGPPARPTTVSFTGRAPIAVKHLVPHNERGVMLARLDAAVADIVPAAIAATAPTAGQAISVAGFGRTATEWAPAAPHSGSGTVASVTAGTVALNLPAAALCKGDTGGPAFIADQAGRMVISAVHTNAGQSGCLDDTSTTTGAQGVRVDDLAAWISVNTWTGFDARRSLFTDNNWSWDNSKTLSGDFTGDGKDDIAVLYKWNDTQSVLHTFTSTGSGLTFNYAVWNSGANGWSWDNSKPVVGDFNGDGKDDIAVLYKWNDTKSVIHQFISTGTGFTFKYAVWESGASGWWWDGSKPVAGDFNGDGKDDIAVLYKWSNTHSVLHTLTSTGTGFTLNYKVWESGAWSWDGSTPTAGDFNGDGKDDIAVLYKQSDTRSVLHTFTSTGTAFTFADAVWNSDPGGWWWNTSTLMAGDFNGDGKDDIAALYKWSDTHSVVHTFAGTGSGFTFGYAAWNSAPDAWSWHSAKPVAADIDGDGKTDVAVLYKTGPLSAAIQLLHSNGTPGRG